MLFLDVCDFSLQLFSVYDSWLSGYCVADWSHYRRLEVLGLADTPTDGAPGLSGFCALYDPEVYFHPIYLILRMMDLDIFIYHPQ